MIINNPYFSPFLLLIALSLISGCTKPIPEKILLSGSTMGTTYHITYINKDDLNKSDIMQDSIDHLLAEVNQVASTYMKNSELSRFNQTKNTTPFVASIQLREMLTEAIRLAELSGGALDVTVGPLVNLWGFGPSHRPINIPTEEQITVAKLKTGIQYVKIKGDAIIKLNPDIYLDLSTLAKGYAVDRVADFLEEQEIEDYLVEIGGEMRLKGKPEDGRNWKVAIEKPLSEQRVVQQVIIPKNSAVASAGDYRNFFEQDNIRYSHIINPKTGKPIAHRLVSVTVIAAKSMVADGLSTALMVMGPHKGLAMAKEQNIAALFIVKTIDGNYSEFHTDNFNIYLPN
ncbi:MAG: FAD:protein FMN transferase [Colwellia sp.]|nr:FAD:protein FMN transferase [Colwellia sp.]